MIYYDEAIKISFQARPEWDKPRLKECLNKPEVGYLLDRVRNTGATRFGSTISMEWRPELNSYCVRIRSYVNEEDVNVETPKYLKQIGALVDD